MRLKLLFIGIVLGLHPLLHLFLLVSYARTCRVLDPKTHELPYSYKGSAFELELIGSLLHIFNEIYYLLWIASSILVSKKEYKMAYLDSN